MSFQVLKHHDGPYRPYSVLRVNGLPKAPHFIKHAELFHSVYASRRPEQPTARLVDTRYTFYQLCTHLTKLLGLNQFPHSIPISQRHLASVEQAHRFRIKRQTRK